MIDEFLSAEEAKKVLDGVDELMREFVDSQRKASVNHQRYPFSSEYYFKPLAVTDSEWEKFYHGLCDTVKHITSVTNAKERLSQRQTLRGQVLGEPIYRLQGLFLMADLATGKTPTSIEQKILKATFHVPHTVAYR